jgi:hypothetical protein
MNRYPLNGTALNGWDTFYGAGTATMTMAADGAAQLGLVAGTATAAMSMAATGNATILGAITGMAAMTMDAVGAARLGVTAGGEAAMEMSAYAVPASITYAAGLAEMVMVASHGLPIPPAIPDVWSDAHRSCVMRVPKDNTTLRVPYDAARV